MWTKILIFMVVFFIVANPATFKIMRGLLGGWVASADGAAKPAGLILHAAVFVALMYLIPRRSYYSTLAERQAEVRQKFAHLDPKSPKNVEARRAKAVRKVKAPEAPAKKAAPVKKQEVQEEPVYDSTPMGGYLF
jgi:hypothetical protein